MYHQTGMIREAGLVCEDGRMKKQKKEIDRRKEGRVGVPTAITSTLFKSRILHLYL